MGFILRLGVSLKDKGEQWNWGWLISLGYSIREVALKHGKIK